MAVRFLLITIDDERPLGPQAKAVRQFAQGVEWKELATLAGVSVRHLQNLVASARICERQAVRRGITVAPLDDDQGDHVMAGLLGGQQAPFVPQPTPTMQDDSAAREAARKVRLAGELAIGRGATILTDYALASQTPATLKKTLGGE